jgi:hypothetical protein
MRVRFVVDKAALGVRRFFRYRLRTIAYTVNRRTSGRGTFKHSSALSDIIEHGRKAFSHWFLLLLFIIHKAL